MGVTRFELNRKLNQMGASACESDGPSPPIRTPPHPYLSVLHDHQTSPTLKSSLSTPLVTAPVALGFLDTLLQTPTRSNPRLVPPTSTSWKRATLTTQTRPFQFGQGHQSPELEGFSGILLRCSLESGCCGTHRNQASLVRVIRRKSEKGPKIMLW